jgi:hypothetical protein
MNNKIIWSGLRVFNEKEANLVVHAKTIIKDLLDK